MNPLSFFDEVWRVAWADMRYLRHNFISVLVGSLVLPLLYFFAFGYGLGDGLTMEGVDYISYMIPGVVALSTLSASFSSTASKVMIQRKFYSSFDELTLCPIGTSSFIVGKCMLGMIRCIISCGILLCLGIVASNDMTISAPLILCILLSSFTFSLLGLCIGLLVSDQAQMTMFSNLIVLPMTFLCGTLFSVDKLPEIARAIINVLPLTPATDCIRCSALGWNFPFTSLILISAYCVVFYLFAHYMIKTGRY